MRTLTVLLYALICPIDCDECLCAEAYVAAAEASLRQGVQPGYRIEMMVCRA